MKKKECQANLLVFETVYPNIAIRFFLMGTDLFYKFNEFLYIVIRFLIYNNR